MILEDIHPELENKHAIFSASKHSWLNKSDSDLIALYINSFAAQIGTLVHAYAKKKILHKQMIEDDKGERNALILYLVENQIPENVIFLDQLFYNFRNYVNDAIGFKMTPEHRLYFSEYCFGTADAVSYYRNTLRIHDLKTGTSPVSMDQLLIYSALFFWQYENKVKLEKSKIELRIYQGQDIIVHNPTPDEISEVMMKISHATAVVESNNMEV